jgi:small subunit ribosomal protein S6
MFILSPALDTDATDKIVAKFEELIKKVKGKVINIDRWGLRKLAYPILNFNEGYYVVMGFEGEPKTAAELNRVFKITDEVIRFLIIKPGK